MFLDFFDELRAARIPVTLKEHLTLLEALKADVIDRRVEDFYYLSRSAYVKDEAMLDRFDQVFGKVVKGLETSYDEETAEIPEEWLKQLAEAVFSEEEMAEIEEKGFDEIMEELKKRLEEQDERHEGGNKWIGTGGKSPFGNGGYNPAGVRIGGQGKQGRAVKVWEKREFKNLDDEVELGTRNIKIALRRLRKFARDGAADELDLNSTIKGTANKGYLDIIMRPERRNAVKVLLFFDIGGSMDGHIRTCEELFSAASSEFKNMEYFYFHNMPYEAVWKDNKRRWSERIPTFDILHKYPHDYKLIFVGDASMSPYEINYPGGSVEHWNEEAGEVWLRRMTDVYHSAVWLNPIPEKHWQYGQSIQMLKTLMEDRMYPLTLGGLDEAMKTLTRSH
ncbi:MAG: VWA domain-containing protein [Pseudomonadota bacterium]